jgi:OOP family OmpA-OmpF porin
VMLAGHTDRSGTPKYNMGLAQRRADSVKAYLGGRGIPAARMTTQAFGETKPRVPTADGVREAQNRRVEVTYGPGSGM